IVYNCLLCWTLNMHLGNITKYGNASITRSANALKTLQYIHPSNNRAIVLHPGVLRGPLESSMASGRTASRRAGMEATTMMTLREFKTIYDRLETLVGESRRNVNRRERRPSVDWRT